MRRLAALFGAAGVILVAVSGWQAWTAYQDIERVTFGDAVAAAENLATIPAAEVENFERQRNVSEEASQDDDTLNLEADVLADLQRRRDEFGVGPEVVEFPFVASPDSLMRYLLPIAGRRGRRVSRRCHHPRAVTQGGSSARSWCPSPADLYLPNPCTQRYSARLTPVWLDARAMRAVRSCFLLMVSDFTGIEVDHFARIDFSGFQKVIDAIGGVEICVEHAVRDAKSFLNLPAGCTQATGVQARCRVARSRRDPGVCRRSRGGPLPGSATSRASRRNRTCCSRSPAS